MTAATYLFSETNLLAIENMQNFWLNSEKKPTLCVATLTDNQLMVFGHS